jgi:membrane protease YdiL (CAAX protease family)
VAQHGGGGGPQLAARCSRLIEEGKLDAKFLPALRNLRIRLAIESRDWKELNAQDVREILAQRFGPWVRNVDPRLLPWLAMLAGIGNLLFIAVVTRCLRKKPPGFLISLLWLPPIAYLSGLVVMPLLPAALASVVAAGLMFWAISGSKAPLGYLDRPASPEGARFGKWWGWPVLCLIAFVGTNAFSTGYFAVWEFLKGQELQVHQWENVLKADSLSDLAAILLVGGFVVPLLEEIVFRGILHDWLVRCLPVFVAVLLINSLFGLLHGWELAIPTAFIGVILSLLRLRFRSLWPCILLHSMNNTIGLLQLFYGVY